jgi:hypothetical protein
MRLLRETVLCLCISLCLAGFSCQKGQPYVGAQDGGAGTGGSGLAGSAGAGGTGGSTDAAVEGVVDAHADEAADAPIESVVVDAPVEGVVDAHVDGAADAVTDHGGVDIVASCRALDDPTNGTVMTPGLTSGSMATYACALGFSLDGSMSRTCQSDGTWSDAAPTCATVSCPSLSAPTGGMISAPSLEYQKMATYSCGTGYALSGGTAVRTCQANGSWSGTAPSCNLVQVSVSVTLKGPLGQGSVLATTPGVDINCGSTCSAIVTYGTTVQLVPSATATGTFVSWSGCSSVTGTTCAVIVGTTDVNVTASFKSKNGGNCGGTDDCNSGYCVTGICCNTSCTGACNGSCATGTCNPLPARTACGTIPGPAGTGSDIAQICDGLGNCAPPTIQCPTGGAIVSCDLSANLCCYASASAFDESCVPAPTPISNNTCTFGQNCAATADCPLGEYCCEVPLASGGSWANCTTSANCTQTQYCDVNATTSGCLQGSCHGGQTAELSVCE